MTFTAYARANVIPNITQFTPGSAAAPGIVFSSGGGSGLFLTGASNVGVAVGGTERAQISTLGITVDGNVTATSMLANINASYITGNISADLILSNGGDFAANAHATLTAPSYGFDNIAGLGMYAPSSTILSLVAGNVEQAQVSTNGLHCGNITCGNVTASNFMTTYTPVTAVANVTVYDTSTGTTFYTSGMTGNFTANFVNVNATNSQVITLKLVLQQGTTPYMPTAVQIEGVSYTVNWIDGITPSGFQNFGTDVVTFTLVRSGGAWVTVLGEVVNYAPTAAAQTLFASDAAAGDNFGGFCSVSGDGTRMIIGAYGKASSTGAAYIFVRNGTTWTQEQKLVASDAAANNFFGSAVAISSDGSRAIVGAEGRATNTGAAYIFVRSGTTWTQEQELTASDGVTGDLFGYSVAISSDGSRVIIGAYGKNSYTGAAYIFVRSGTTWTQEQKLTASNGSANNNFGTSVTISSDGTRVGIGANAYNSTAGTAYTFLWNGTTWIQEQQLTASDAATSNFFGQSIALSGDNTRIVVGAYENKSAYVFVLIGTTWYQEQKLTASDAATSGLFGSSVAISYDGSRVIVGAYNRTYGSTSGVGAAYVFSRTGEAWTQDQIILPSYKTVGVTTNLYFGSWTSMTYDGTRVVIGASGAQNIIGAIGAAFVESAFKRRAVNWTTY